MRLINENKYLANIPFLFRRSCIEEVEANVDLLEQKLDKVFINNL